MSARLDEEQREAVNADGNLLVLACPGSGKTFMLSKRAVRLLQTGPGQLALVSFTKDSADELAQRTIREGGGDLSKRLISGTFHSLCMRQIQAAERAGTLPKAGLRLAGPSEISAAAAHAVREEQWPGSVEDACEVISIAKTVDGTPPDRVIAGLVHVYDQSLAKAGLMDFADMIRVAVAGMRSGSIKRLQVNWMLVDESQDMDGIQKAWVECHTKAGVMTTLVGDDDQCHPPDTLVEGVNGEVRIDSAELPALARYSIDPKIGTVRMSAWVQVQRRSRRHTGRMITFHAGGRSVSVTPNHKMVVRVPEGPAIYAVLAVCNADAAIHLRAVRLGSPRHTLKVAARRLGAEYAWWLRTSSDWDDALEQVRELGSRHCVPYREDMKAIDGPYADAGAETAAAASLLQAHNLSIARPLVSPAGQRTRSGLYPHIVIAEHVCLGQYELPIVVDGLVTWHPIERVEVSPYDGEVHSLSVPLTRLYRANGFVVHNSIYEWRSALGYSGMEGFAKDNNAHTVVLRRCYRCAPEILTPAGRVIVHNPLRQEKLLLSMAEAGGHSEVRTFSDRTEEIRSAAMEIAEDPQSWAILGRTNSLLRLMAGELTVQQIPFTAKGGESIWDAPPVRAYTDLLTGLVTDNASRLGHALVHSGSMSLQQVGALGPTSNGRASEMIRQIAKGLDIGVFGAEDPEKRRRLNEIVKSWSNWRRLADGGSADAGLVVSAARQWMGGKAWGENERAAVVIASEILTGYRGNLKDRVSAVRSRLVGARDDRRPRAESGAALLTLHGSKGLEYTNVWILGCEDGMVPLNSGIPEEERRLMYVGMTRAKRQLLMSWSIAGEKVEPSRYFHEAELMVRS